MCSKCFLFFSAAIQNFAHELYMCVPNLVIIAHILGQTKYLCDCDMHVFWCCATALAGNKGTRIFLRAMEGLFSFLVSLRYASDMLC